MHGSLPLRGAEWTAWALSPPRRSADCATRRGGGGPLRWPERPSARLGVCEAAALPGTAVGRWVLPAPGRAAARLREHADPSRRH